MNLTPSIKFNILPASLELDTIQYPRLSVDGQRETLYETADRALRQLDIASSVIGARCDWTQGKAILIVEYVPVPLKRSA